MAHAQDTQWQEFYDIDGVAYGKAAVLTRGLLHLGIDYLQADLFNYTMMKDTWTNNITLPPEACLLYTSPSPRDDVISRMPSSA